MTSVPASATAASKPDAELEQIATLETRRRRLIPEVEGLKREQNAAGDEVARAKRQGQDASGIFAANKARGQQIRQLEVQLDQVEQQRAALLMTLPNLPHATRPGRPERRRERGSAPGRRAEVVRLRSEAALGARPRARHPRLRARDEDVGVALLGAARRRRAARARADQLHARPAHARARVHRGRAAVSRQRRRAARHRATCRSSSRICSRSPASGICI